MKACRPRVLLNGRTMLGVLAANLTCVVGARARLLGGGDEDTGTRPSLGSIKTVLRGMDVVRR